MATIGFPLDWHWVESSSLLESPALLNSRMVSRVRKHLESFQKMFHSSWGLFTVHGQLSPESFWRRLLSQIGVADLSARHSLISPSPLNCPLSEQQTPGSVRPAAVPFPSWVRHWHKPCIQIRSTLRLAQQPLSLSCFLTSIRSFTGRQKDDQDHRSGGAVAALGRQNLLGKRRQTNTQTHTCMHAWWADCPALK